jgi:AcrR family transcriptional regulator
VAEVFRTASQREVDAVAQAAALEPGAAEAVAAVVETFAGRALRAPRKAYALLAEPVDPAVDAERLVFRRAYAAVFARLIERGIAAGELPDQDVRVSAAAVVGALGEALVGPLAADATAPVGSPVRPRDDAIASLITYIQRSIGAIT